MSSRFRIRILIVVTLCFSLGRADTTRPDQCFECATPGLKSRWYVTGFPNYPTGLDFSDSCLTGAAKVMGNGAGTCSGMCFEMTFPLDGAQQMVRGCYRDFLRGYEDIVNTKARCDYSIDTSNTTVVTVGTTGKTNMPITVMRVCKGTEETGKACNGEFIIQPEQLEAFKGDKAQVELTCKRNGIMPTQLETGKECISCSRFGDDGTCKSSTKNTCRSGAYCTKMHGDIGNNDVEIRGCAVMNPFTDAEGQPRDVCTYIDGTFNVPLMYGLGPEYSFKNTQMCICKGDRCNSAWSHTPILTAILSMLTVLSFLA